MFLVAVGGSKTLLLCKGFVRGLQRLLFCLEECCISGKRAVFSEAYFKSSGYVS